MITVVGSVNMDLITETDKIPANGETLLGEKFSTSPGGKGANQAVAASRLGGSVQMIATVGDDVFGKELRSHLEQENVDVTNIKVSSQSSTGVANIILTDNDNRIMVIPAANYDLSAEDLLQLNDIIQRSKIVVVQMEILPAVVKALAHICHENKVPIIINPAPAEHFDKDLISAVDFLTPNESECRDIFDMDIEQALEKYPNKLIVTLGKDGAQYFDGQNHIRVPSIPTKVVDTTGAGDTFNGALAYAIINHYDLKDAVLFANAAASLSVETLGAQTGMPSKAQVEKRLEEVRHTS